MRNAKRKIVTIVIGLAGLVAAGATVAWTGATSGQAPAGVIHLADEMHWITGPNGLPIQVPDAPSLSSLPDDEMHW